jgi:hypothetical protein
MGIGKNDFHDFFRFSREKMTFLLHVATFSTLQAFMAGSSFPANYERTRRMGGFLCQLQMAPNRFVVRMSRYEPTKSPRPKAPRDRHNLQTHPGAMFVSGC